MRGNHCIKYWSTTQASIVLSTAEAELVALVKGACEAKGVSAIVKDMTGKDLGAVGLYTDASAAIGIAQRFKDGQSTSHRRRNAVDTAESEGGRSRHTEGGNKIESGGCVHQTRAG